MLKVMSFNNFMEDLKKKKKNWAKGKRLCSQKFECNVIQSFNGRVFEIEQREKRLRGQRV